MTLPPYPGQPEQPEQPGQPVPPPPPAPPAPPAPPGPPAPPAYPQTYPQTPSGGSTPPPPPGPPAPPAPPSYEQFGGQNDASRSWSALAIAAFVCSLTCCLGIPAIILGIIALTKTGAGKAKGRWMAVLGIVLGVIGTLMVIGLLTGGYFLAKNAVVTPDNAKVGQCVSVETKGDTVTMVDFGCSTDHNGQIFAVLTLTDADVKSGMGGLDLCVEEAQKAFPTATAKNLLGPRPTITIDNEVLEIGGSSVETTVVAGNRVACWAEATDGTLTVDLVD